MTDHGEYSEVVNLTTTAPISISGDEITFTAPDGKFYYQGTLENREIPWLLPSSMCSTAGPPTGGAGRSERHLDITVQSAKPSADDVYRDTLRCRRRLPLTARPAKTSARPRTIADVGADKQLSYIILPGKEKDFTFRRMYKF